MAVGGGSIAFATEIAVAPNGNIFAANYTDDTFNHPEVVEVFNNAVHNVISGNQADGIEIDASNSNVIQGNAIGTDDNGLMPVGNDAAGVNVHGQSQHNLIGAAGSGASPDALERNVISANDQEGVRITDSGTSYNVVAGNYIGTDATGEAALGNGGSGVSFGYSPSNNRVGTTGTDADDAGERNVISGNLGNGIHVGDSGTSGNLFAGNYIGLDAAGVKAIGNAWSGILLRNGADGNTIGWDGVGNAADMINVISGNGYIGDSYDGEDGIRITDEGTTANLIDGNYLGTDHTGTVGVGNVGAGIYNYESTGNTIGGTVAGSGNVLSGNSSGIVVASANSLYDPSSALIVGNLIGTDKTGLAGVGNVNYGIQFVSTGGSTVGGTASGAGNIISANKSSGIYVDFGETAIGELIQGNLIGLNKNDAVLGNLGYGVDLSGFDGNTVGGSTAGAGNVIAANAANASGGTQVIVASDDNLISGNLIGTTPDGLATLGSEVSNAIYVTGSKNTIGGIEAIGATGAGARNIIGDALYGIYVVGAGATANVVEGNYVGVNAAGNAKLGGNSGSFGVDIDQQASGNLVGGTATGSGNLISGWTDGVLVNNGAPGNQIAGNMIGTDATGSQDISNITGIYDVGKSTTIGGTAMGAANLISGNATANVALYGTGSIVVGNLIGTNATGTAAVSSPNPNGLVGISVTGTANSIGAGAIGNLISGNYAGIAGGGIGTVVSGNEIGTDLSGTKAIPNVEGILFNNANTSATIGGTLLGAGNLISGNTQYGIEDMGAHRPAHHRQHDRHGQIGPRGPAQQRWDRRRERGIHHHRRGGVGARNLISGNTQYGIDLAFQANSVVVQSNYIGTDITGENAMANGTGVAIFGLGLSSNVIGGSVAGADNVISGNGIGIDLVGTSGNTVEGNYIGVDQTGTQRLGNTTGILVDGSSGNTIGGTAFKARNVISGNLAQGILSENQSTSNRILGNYIGTDQSGSNPLGNSGPGIEFMETTGTVAAAGNIVGGTLGGSRNIISANAGDGILFTGSEARGDLVQDNYIGTDLLGTTPIGNSLSGIEVTNGAGAITIGGTAAGAANLIAFNGSTSSATVTAGVLATGGPVLISGNSTYSNARLGIDLNGSGIPLLNAPMGTTNYPVILSASYDPVNNLSNYSGTLDAAASTPYQVEIFRLATANASGYGEGQTFVGAVDVTTDSGGHASFLLSVSGNLPKHVVLSATATNLTTLTTSEYAQNYGGSHAPTARAASMVTGVEGTPIQFDGSGSLDQDGDTLNYTWNFGDGTLPVAGAQPLHAFTAPGTYHVTLTVDNGFGQSSTATITAVVANVAPTFAPTGYQNPLVYGGGSSIGGYGTTVAAFDDRFAVAAPGDGVVTLYDPSTGKLLTTFSDPGSGGIADEFGASMATVDGQYLIIGAPGTSTSLTGTGDGAAYLFDADPQSPTFGRELARYLPTSRAGEQDDAFGTSVAGFGLNVLIGAPGMHDSHGVAVGAVFEFDANPTSPTFGQSLLQPTLDPNDAGGDEFGESLAALGADFAVGAPYAGVSVPGMPANTPAGAVFVFNAQANPAATISAFAAPGGLGFGKASSARPSPPMAITSSSAPGRQFRLSLQPAHRHETRDLREPGQRSGQPRLRLIGGQHRLDYPDRCPREQPGQRPRRRRLPF